MKIVFVNQFFFPDQSATSQLLTDLAFHLARHGYQVSVVASRQRFDDPAAILPAREKVEGVDVYRVWTTRFGRGFLLGRALDSATFYSSAAWRLLRIASRNCVIVAKTDPPMIGVVAWLCARLRGARLVNWVQDVFPEIAQTLGVKVVGGAAGMLLRRIRNLSLHGAEMNVALGERMAERLVEQGTAKERIAIIANWADGAAIRPLAPEDNPLRREWGLEGKFVVGYSGNMGRAHEFAAIMGAAELLKDEPRVVFLFIGGGHGKASLERKAAERGLASLRFKPFQPRSALGLSLTVPDAHLISLRPELEGYVLPSKFYGAIAAGRPVLFIGSPEGELPPLLEKNECGLVFAADEAARLAESIRRLNEARDLSARMGRNARALFERRFDKPLALAAWEELLRVSGKKRA